MGSKMGSGGPGGDAGTQDGSRRTRSRWEALAWVQQGQADWGVLGQVLVVATRVGQDGHGDMRGHPAHPAPPAPQDGQLATTTPPGHGHSHGDPPSLFPVGDICHRGGPRCPTFSR